jgi:hypothetical protein
MDEDNLGRDRLPNLSQDPEQFAYQLGGINVDASYEDNLNLPFVMRADDVEKLSAFVSGATGKCEVILRCRDGVQRRTSQISEVLRYENPSDREIQSVTIEGRGGEPRSSIELTFSSGFFHSVSVRIRTEESKLVRLKDSLGVILNGLRPWYASAARRDIYGTILTIVFLLYVVVLISMLVDLPSGPLPKEQMEWLRSAVFLSLAATWPAAWIQNKIRARVFPDACFAIGQGLRHYETQEKIRWIVVIGLAVSVAAGLILMVV